MKQYNVFVDGSAGTTGLRIEARLSQRADIHLVRLPEHLRKDLDARVQMINQCDLAFLCLPDAAAREIAPRIDPRVKLLDTSTAHRTAPGWVYGLPELSGRRAQLAGANRVAVPGCHATGFIVLVAPLVQAELVPADARLSCHSLTGYSGGGKPMIAQYEQENRSALLHSPRAYGLGLAHKHLPEMCAQTGLVHPPIFCPIVADFYSGMQVSVPLPCAQWGITPAQLADALAAYYKDEAQVQVFPLGAADADGFLASNGNACNDTIEIFITGNEENALLTARFDNLGKGSSGAAVQCMNLLLGTGEQMGLEERKPQDDAVD